MKANKLMCGVVVMVLAAGFVPNLAEYAGGVTVAAQAPRTSLLKGVIKSIDDSAVVVVPNENKDVEVSFKISSGTTRTGAVATGDEVTVSYHFEQTQRVATALAGKAK